VLGIFVHQLERGALGSRDDDAEGLERADLRVSRVDEAREAEIVLDDALNDRSHRRLLSNRRINGRIWAPVPIPVLF
jgi:hypothetical protein